ncbi:NADase-type glycan-binding domain-containing protein [Dethiosulfovibrio salsuginis]|uniref:NAD glycohydrolase translocation F5/8 type C domain-containing protein n=1 Tax=Dethiosulfovibrio salsuginis TaxID=561720 RepID=A0A1X7J3K6_9BACT|nr:hypothetical protein [Dethiosulfovibrio salsuginis]SMG22159.1 hypothetical protein SAMN06275492_10811 [Dethiosulfovibrio salsuginis]
MKTRITALAISLILAAGPSWGKCSEAIYTELVDGYRFCVSSVLSPQGKFTYGPENLLNPTGQTTWCEGVPGDGIGEYILMEWGNPYALKSMVVENGYVKSEKAFLDNNRVKRARIETSCGVVMEVQLKDQRGTQRISFPYVVKPTWIKFTILDVYRGRKYKDTCVSSIWPDFEETRWGSH